MNKEDASTKLTAIQKLLRVMEKLRDPENGCSWDLEQTHSSIASYTIEEAYEVADALETGDPDHIKEELGDLLFQVVFHAQISSEKGGFDLEEIAETVTNKMIDRHPHVFSQKKGATSEHINPRWEDLKENEREKIAHKKGQKASALDGVALAFPSLIRAQKIQKRAAKQGFDWRSLAPVIAKVHEELYELEAEINGANPRARIEEELGDLLFASVNLARHLEIDAETALKKATEKFSRRFRYLESELRSTGKELKKTDLEEMERLWFEAKSHE